MSASAWIIILLVASLALSVLSLVRSEHVMRRAIARQRKGQNELHAKLDEASARLDRIEASVAHADGTAAAAVAAIAHESTLTEQRLAALGRRTADTTIKYVTQSVRKEYEQVQGAVNLFSMVDVRAPMPPLRGWAISPDALLEILRRVVERKPNLIVECGSGSSTVWTALLAEQMGLPTRIISLDHEAGFAEQTRALARMHGVAHRIDVRDAPLEPFRSEGYDAPWYALDACRDIGAIDMLVVDGPPGASSPLARYPALPVFASRMQPNALLLLDDSIRAEEKEIRARWLQEYPGLTEVYLPVEKGLAVLSVPADGLTSAAP